MTNDEMDIDRRILNVIASCLGLDKDGRISMDSSLMEIGFESLTFIKTIIALESEFNFEFDDERLLAAEFETFGDMVNYVLLEISLA